jgi:yeast amino acid transporter
MSSTDSKRSPVYLFVVFGIHMLPNRWFGEFEFGTAAAKVLMMFVIIFACIAMIAGAGPIGSTHHAENYTQLPAFPNGFKVRPVV